MSKEKSKALDNAHNDRSPEAIKARNEKYHIQSMTPNITTH